MGTQAFTVVLSVPDYKADQFGKDVVVVHLRGYSVEEAITRARAEVVWLPDFSDAVPEDFVPVFVCEGTHDNLVA